MNSLNDIDDLRGVVAKWQPWGEEDDRGVAQPVSRGASDRAMLLTAVLTLTIFFAATVASGYSPFH
jgi:hypothetical protein